MENIKALRKLIGNMPLTICAAGVIIKNQNNHILLIKRGDDGNWCIPGGIVDLGEKVEGAAKREVYEETNLMIDKMELFNVYSGKEQHHIYPNGDEVYFINVVFISSFYYGKLNQDGIESKEVKFFSLNDLPNKISPTNIPFIEDLKNRIE
jgi:ADP-ribose pyrophosphatase YjhB (NUDIX family)